MKTWLLSATLLVVAGRLLGQSLPSPSPSPSPDAVVEPSPASPPAPTTAPASSATSAATPAAPAALTTESPPPTRLTSTLVDSWEALQSSLEAAQPGDTLILKNGVYTTKVALKVTQRGTATAPITIQAETVGGVEIAGAHGFTINEPAEQIVIAGFNFTHASGRNTVGAGTSQVRFTRNVFRCSGEGAYLSVNGDDAQIDHNEFADKKTAGSMIAVGGTGSQAARRVSIHHNHLHDFATAGAVGSEMIRLGLGSMSASTGGAVVEHNLFERCRGVNELISNRCSGNIFRYNTLLESPSSQLTLRHGNDCLVYGNIFRNTEGLRIYGDRHQVFSNWFEGNYIGINLGNGSAEMAEGGSLSGHDRPDRCLIAFNTLIDNRTHYQMSRRTQGALGATQTVFANNLISGSGIAAKIEGPNLEATWSGNILWVAGGSGDVPAGSYVEADPQWEVDPAGVRRPKAGSPVFEAAIGDFPLVTVDLEGQPRPAKKSIGAQEPRSGATVAHLLAPADVGPNAK